MKGIEWLAGLLEGEGCFSYIKGSDSKDPIRRFYPRIELGMTDRDVVDEVAKFWKKNVHRRPPLQPQHKAFYRVMVNGPTALASMLDVYPHMGERRKAKIEEVLNQFEHSVIPA